jgi:hypothetical protein
LKPAPTPFASFVCFAVRFFLLRALPVLRAEIVFSFLVAA